MRGRQYSVEDQVIIIAGVTAGVTLSHSFKPKCAAGQ